MSDKEFEVEHETITFILSLRLNVGIHFVLGNYSEFLVFLALSSNCSE